MSSSVYDLDDDSPSPSDHEELLHLEESEPSSDAEEQTATCSVKDSPDGQIQEAPFSGKGRKCAWEICVAGISLMLSSTVLMILYPVYTERTQATPVMFLVPSSCCVIFLFVLTQSLGRTGCIQEFSTTRCPIPYKRLCEAVLCYGSGCLMVSYAQVKGRVPCHLQDPLKAVVVLYSLLYYFLFCKKMLGLRKLFAASVMAVGLFIAADYGLCDEFKCRGAESRMDTGWESRIGWTLVYLIGLGLFTLYFTIMEENIMQRPVGAYYMSFSGSLLFTVSRMVSREELDSHIYEDKINSDQNFSSPIKDQYLTMNQDKPKKSSILMALWIQGFTWLIIIISGTFYMAASAANNTQNSELLWNNTINALTCHVPQWEVNQVVHHSVNTLPAAQLSGDNSKFFKSNLQLLAEIELMQGNAANINKRDTHVLFLERNKRSEDQDKESKRLIEPHKSSLKKHHKIKKIKHNLKKHTILQKETPKNNSSKFYESSRHTENDKNIIESKIDIQSGKNSRNKRSSVQTNALGFKIIHPTDSILQGHVITNKLNPDLVGHVILNKTSININGHEITFKQDLFIREHDPLPAKMHRLHRGRPDIRFLTDLMNMTDTHNTSNKRSVRQTPIRERVSSNVNRDRSKVLLIKINDSEERNKRDTQQSNLNKNYSSEIILSRKYENLESQNKQFNIENVDEKSKDACCLDNEYTKENHNSDYAEIVSASDFDKSIIWNAGKQEVRDSEVIKYDASKSNIVRITDKTISEEKHNDNSDVIYAITKIKLKNCGYTYVYGWVVVIAYIVFSISSIRFLTLCQSSVFTIAMMSPALPLSGVWWAMFSQNSDGSLLMHPGLSGELICALLGLPIVTLGLMLLFKAHFFQTSFSYPNQGILNRIYNDNTRSHESHINICDPNNENHIQHMA